MVDVADQLVPLLVLLGCLLDSLDELLIDEEFEADDFADDLIPGIEGQLLFVIEVEDMVLDLLQFAMGVRVH